VTQSDAKTGLTNVWVLDLARGTRALVTSDASNHQHSIWSPDGSRIVFSSNRDGHYDLYEKASNGTGPDHELVKDDASKFPSQWSSDGVVYHRVGEKTKNDLWLLPIGPDRTPKAYLKTQFREMQGQVSPKGRWLAYTSDESGRLEVYVGSFPAGPGKWPVSTADGGDPHWRRDGRELFYLGEDCHMMAVPIQATSAFQSGTAQPLFETAMSVNTVTFASQHDVTADGRKFLVKIPVDGDARAITVLLNWPAAVKK
jgi:Tol biopolymer transport system component